MDAAGFAQDIEIYRVATSATAAVGRRLIAPLVVLFVVLVLLGSLTGSPRIGLGLGILGTAGAASIMSRRLRAGIGTTVVRLSEEGPELLDGQGFGFRLRWPDVSEVGQVSGVLE